MLDEFAAATEITKLNRFALIKGGRCFFDLLGIDGKLHYFAAEPDAISNVAFILYELARNSRWLQAGLPQDQFYASHLPGAIPADRASDADSFMGPKLKVLRATEHLDRLADVLRRFEQEAQLTCVEVENDGTTATYEVRLNVPAPGIIPILIGDVAHNLRAALDLSICAVIPAPEPGRPDRRKFPFAKNALNLEKLLREEIEPFNPDLADEIRELKPYPGGNGLLNGLHELDIVQKHRMIIPVYFGQVREYDMGLALTEKFAESGLFPDLKVEYIGIAASLLSVGDRIVRPCGHEPMKYHPESPNPLMIRFPSDVPEPFGHNEVFTALANIAQLVGKVCYDIREKFGPDEESR